MTDLSLQRVNVILDLVDLFQTLDDVLAAFGLLLEAARRRRRPFLFEVELRAVLYHDLAIIFDFRVSFRRQRGFGDLLASELFPFFLRLFVCCF